MLKAINKMLPNQIQHYTNETKNQDNISDQWIYSKDARLVQIFKNQYNSP